MVFWRFVAAHLFWLLWSLLGMAVCIGGLVTDGWNVWLVFWLTVCAFCAGARLAWMCPR